MEAKLPGDLCDYEWGSDVNLRGPHKKFKKLLKIIFSNFNRERGVMKDGVQEDTWTIILVCVYICLMEITSAEFKKGIIGTNEILQDGRLHVAFIGRSNVGKSSVINTLVVRKNLVKSSRSPGKTTEINFFLINNEVYFVDLPGYGYAKLSQKLREKLRKMILWYIVSSGVKNRKTVLIIDAKVGLTEFDRQMLGVLEDVGDDIVVVANKIDKVKKNDIKKRLTQLEDEIKRHTIILFSAKTKYGRKDLLEKIFN